MNIIQIPLGYFPACSDTCERLCKSNNMSKVNNLFCFTESNEYLSLELIH